MQYMEPKNGLFCFDYILSVISFAKFKCVRPAGDPTFDLVVQNNWCR